MRYFTAPKARARVRADWIDDEYPMLPQITVSDHEATDTGLIDTNGDCIMRAPNPMGFVWGDD